MGGNAQLSFERIASLFGATLPARATRRHSLKRARHRSLPPLLGHAHVSPLLVVSRFRWPRPVCVGMQLSAAVPRNDRQSGVSAASVDVSVRTIADCKNGIKPDCFMNAWALTDAVRLLLLHLLLLLAQFNLH